MRPQPWVSRSLEHGLGERSYGVSWVRSPSSVVWSHQHREARLSVNDRRQVVYRLKHPFRNGTTHVVLDPMDFIARLVAPEVPLAQRAR